MRATLFSELIKKITVTIVPVSIPVISAWIPHKEVSTADLHRWEY